MNTYKGIMVDVDQEKGVVTVGVSLGFGISANIRLKVFDFTHNTTTPFDEVYVVEHEDGSIYVHNPGELGSGNVLFRGRML